MKVADVFDIFTLQIRLTNYLNTAKKKGDKDAVISVSDLNDTIDYLRKCVDFLTQLDVCGGEKRGRTD